MTRDPASVPCTVIAEPSALPALAEVLSAAERIAIDTEVPIDGPAQGRLRVMSIAVRLADGSERSYVVDVRDLDPTLLAPCLTGITADAWNANFDARVIDAAVWQTADTTPALGWWDAQIADALLHQGRSGFTWYHGLAWAARQYLGLEVDGKGSVQLSFTSDGDLTEEQVGYAAADAVETLWVGDEIRKALEAAGLEQIAEIELAARPFLDRMERTGLWFDWDAWQGELCIIETQSRAVLGRLAELTGGGQGNLFDEIVEPTWNPASDRQVKDALNRWSESEVFSWTADRYGTARHLSEGDSVSAAVLREIGGPVSEAILDLRNHTKILTTYGESIGEHLHDDGRLHPQYLQVVGTNTGRLASRNPNAQNFTPRMLPFVRPAEPERVFVHADLSQAELRYLAQVADDAPLRAAFDRGDDVHVRTAASMFGFEPEELQSSDPTRFQHLRKIAKALNFGIAYGTGAAALARSLTAEGSPTAVDEAADLLAVYRRTYPGTAEWAEARIAEIQALREETSAIDWPATLRLARGFAGVADVRREFRKTKGRWPTAAEITTVHPQRHTSDLDELRAEIEWLLRYPAPVALLADGEPFTFSSRTIAGRRQQFNLHLDRLFLMAITDAIRTDRPAVTEVRRRFNGSHQIDLYGPGADLSTDQIERAFENRSLRRRFMDAVVQEIGPTEATQLLGRAARERVGAMVNAWRNAPIQGGVADIMLVAYADLDRRLRAYPDARPVQTVHDSVVVECNRSSSASVAREVREALEEASRRFCPDVSPRADVDIRTTLSDDDAEPAAVGVGAGA